MRPLNRPMFKIGGPVKEGIMSGMQDRPGYSTGRIVTGALSQLPKIKNFYSQTLVPKIKNIFQTPAGTKTVTKQGPTFEMPAKTTYSKGYRGTIPGKKITPGTGEVPIYKPNILGRDPTVRLVGGVYKAITDPRVTGVAGKAAQLVFSPTGVVTGLLYANGRYFNKDTGEEVPPPPNADQLSIGAPGGDSTGNVGPAGIKSDGTYGTAADAKAALERNVIPKEDPPLTANEQREALKKKYYDIMEIDKLTKRATGDALIAASQDLANLNREGITLKEGLRSGDLQSRLIASASKAFDKPDKTKSAIDAAILKAEITKDINKEKDALAAELTQKRIQVADKQLAGSSFEEVVSDATVKGFPPKGKSLATLFRAKTGFDASVLDSSKVPQGVDEEVYLQGEVESARKDGTPIPPGYYVISSSIFIIDEAGNISRRL
tara:strand:+ start:1083 stop:2384 length:1302 start_codon:yes stop_codon:yes gene_type:complete